jgi:hypothetical protein
MLYLPITRAWIVSPLARRSYLLCALLAVALFGTLVAVSAAMVASGVRSLAGAPAAVLTVKVLILPEVFGTAALSVAMWYFWFTFDRSSWAKKALWFPPLYFFPTMGPALYYFFVYRRQTPAPKERQNAAQGASPG